MLIPDLFNILFDQCDHSTIIILAKLYKRQTAYATKYSSLRRYVNDGVFVYQKYWGDEPTKLVHNRNYIPGIGNLKVVKYFARISTHSDLYIVYSARDGSLEAVKYFAKVCTNKSNALPLAAANGYFEIVKYLWSIGADFDLENYYALRWSARYGHLDVVKFLVRIGADVHAEDDYALQWSARNGFIDIVKFLVSAGANVNADYDCALRWSAKHGHFDVVKYLVSVGANVNIHDGVVLRESAKHLEIVKYLVHVGVHVSGAHGYDALVKSVKHEKVDVVKYLISVGVTVDINDNKIVSIPVSNGNLEILECLVNAGVHIDYLEQLKCSLGRGHVHVSNYLMKQYLTSIGYVVSPAN